MEDICAAMDLDIGYLELLNPGVREREVERGERERERKGGGEGERGREQEGVRARERGGKQEGEI